MGKKHSCSQSFDPSDQAYGLRELWLQAEDNGQAQFVHSQICEAPQKIRSTVLICGFQLWSHLELSSMALAKRMRIRKRAEKIDARVGEKNYCFLQKYEVYSIRRM